MCSTAAVCPATYAVPAASVVRRTVSLETVTPVQKANAAAVYPQDIHVPDLTRLS